MDSATGELNVIITSQIVVYAPAEGRETPSVFPLSMGSMSLTHGGRGYDTEAATALFPWDDLSMVVSNLDLEELVLSRVL